MIIFTNTRPATVDLVAAHLGWPRERTVRSLERIGPEAGEVTILAAFLAPGSLTAVLDRCAGAIRECAAAAEVSFVLVNDGGGFVLDAEAFEGFYARLDALGISARRTTIITANLAILHRHDGVYGGREERVRFHFLSRLPGDPADEAANAPITSDTPGARVSLLGGEARVEQAILAAQLLRDGHAPARDYGSNVPVVVDDAKRDFIDRHKANPANRLTELVAQLADKLALMQPGPQAPARPRQIVLVIDEVVHYGGLIQIPRPIRRAVAEGRPFLVLGGPHALRMVRALGFRTFAPLLDEAYDDVMDPNVRIELLVQEVGRLLGMGEDDFGALGDALAEITAHNRRHLARLDAEGTVPLALPGPADTPAARESASLDLSRSLREAAVDSRFSVPARSVPEYRRTAPLPVPRPAPPPAAKPRVAIVSHLASSGGTAISKCLGTMGGVTLLSEIHPMASLSMVSFNPLDQYRRWFGLSDTLKGEIDALANCGEATVVDILECLAVDAARRGTILLLRDWSHVDYVAGGGLPPRRRPSLLELVAPRMATSVLVTTRHPLDVWLSMVSSRFAKPEAIGPVMGGFRHFAEYAATNGFLTYEAFTEAPDRWLREATGRLGLPFDPTWSETWADYRTITGDSGRRSGDIAPRPRRPVSEETTALVNVNSDYRRACALLGYD
ncbi:hypothetical protein DLJ53_17035 [Acuticoccus sediminis]|uniref:Uncharacterized protein n=1 Tax=Acuticoccus sediminis TaxID=2184697 RepID=A0A8B2NQI5_9HYPH|nr:hypothetical protein [Acuticoccus sediminis]RAI00932.1 hypothetical protein DLJ53_17035 [Acuticoccus sediminis]